MAKAFDLPKAQLPLSNRAAGTPEEAKKNKYDKISSVALNKFKHSSITTNHDTNTNNYVYNPKPG